MIFFDPVSALLTKLRKSLAKEMTVNSSKIAQVSASVGSYVSYNGRVYKVISAITSGVTDLTNPSTYLSNYSDGALSELSTAISQKNDQEEVILNVLGSKNLLKNITTSQTANGVTFTVNKDGTVNVNGTASATIDFHLNQYDGSIFNTGNYIVSGSPKTGSRSTYCIWARTIRSGNVVTEGIDYGNGAEISHTNENDKMHISIVIYGGYTANNLTFKPMLRPKGILDDTFAEYSMTNRELTDQIAEKANQSTLAPTCNDATAPAGGIPANFFFYHNGELYYTPTQIAQGSEISATLKVDNGGLNKIVKAETGTLSNVLSGLVVGTLRIEKKNKIVRLCGYFYTTSQITIEKNTTLLFKMPWKPKERTMVMIYNSGSSNTGTFLFTGVIETNGGFYMDQPGTPKTLSAYTFMTFASPVIYFTND